MTGIPEGERPHVERTPQQPKHPEHTQPLQGRAEGRESLQGPTTFDGHEPDVWERSSAIFKSRTIEGMRALREKVDRVQHFRDVVTNESARVDRCFSSEDEIKLGAYFEGLADAFNLIAQHIRGKTGKENPQGEVSQAAQELLSGGRVNLKDI